MDSNIPAHRSCLCTSKESISCAWGNVFDVGGFFSPRPLHVGKKRFDLCLFSQLPIKSSLYPRKIHPQKKILQKTPPWPCTCFLPFGLMHRIYRGFVPWGWVMLQLNNSLPGGSNGKNIENTESETLKINVKRAKKRRGWLWLLILRSTSPYPMIKTITKKITVIQESPVVSFFLVGCG